MSEQAAVTEKSMDAPHEELNMEVIAPQEGYLFSYLSHEENSNVEVYFDDFALTLAGGPIVQVDDFYPYGMAFNHEASDNAVLNRYLYQGKEKISDDTDWYDFHARLYSPALGRFLGVDPAGQFASPYNGMGNNPVIGVDPDGEFVFTALALLIPGGQIFLPMAIGADLGMWQGGSIANGTGNPLQWNYSSGKTWGYMAGGAAAGGLSGGAANAVATSGIAFANTAAIATGSFINSIGTFAYTGGQTDISISFGAASYNFTQNKLGYLGKKGNSLLENVGYGLGAFANLSDSYGFIKGAYGKNASDVTLNSDNHSKISKNGKDIFDVGMTDEDVSNIMADGRGIDDAFKRGNLTTDYTNTPPGIFNRNQLIQNVRLDKLAEYRAALETSGRGFKLTSVFGGKNMNCAVGASQALLKAGVLNTGIGIPGLLSFQMYMRTYSIYSYSLIY